MGPLYRDSKARSPKAPKGTLEGTFKALNPKAGSRVRGFSFGHTPSIKPLWSSMEVGWGLGLTLGSGLSFGKRVFRLGIWVSGFWS